MSETQTAPLCPSAEPSMAGAVAFGVVAGTAQAPRLRHLREPQPATPELLALAQPVTPTEVFRFAAPCAERGCRHFDGADCRLAAKITALLEPAVERAPGCRLRPACRWWRQEGMAACLRCPGVVSSAWGAPPALAQAADPSV